MAPQSLTASGFCGLPPSIGSSGNPSGPAELSTVLRPVLRAGRFLPASMLPLPTTLSPIESPYQRATSEKSCPRLLGSRRAQGFGSLPSAVGGLCRPRKVRKPWASSLLGSPACVDSGFLAGPCGSPMSRSASLSQAKERQNQASGRRRSLKLFRFSKFCFTGPRRRNNSPARRNHFRF